MFKCMRMILLTFLCLPDLLFARMPVNSMVVFGDSLSDTGNTSFLLKSIRQDEDPAYLVKPLKVFFINKMQEFAEENSVPDVILHSGIRLARQFFDQGMAPVLASLITKIKKLPVLPGEPYWQARFSNGPVWNEYLAAMLNMERNNLFQFTNQAFGGSWAATFSQQLTVWNLIRHPIYTAKSLIVGKLIPPSLGVTVQAYLLMNKQLNSQGIYFIFSGANDYMNALHFEDNYNPAVMSQYIDNVIDGLTTIVMKLRKSGAMHIVVLGLPNIGDAPKFMYTLDRAILNNAVQWHNERLVQRVREWQNTYNDVDFLYVDVQKIFQDELLNKQLTGFTHVTEPCIDLTFSILSTLPESPFTGNYVLEYAQMLQLKDKFFRNGDKNYHICDTPEKYLFWDEIHPTTGAHYYLARGICQVMKIHGYNATCDTDQIPNLRF